MKWQSRVRRAVLERQGMRAAATAAAAVALVTMGSVTGSLAVGTSAVVTPVGPNRATVVALTTAGGVGLRTTSGPTPANRKGSTTTTSSTTVTTPGGTTVTPTTAPPATTEPTTTTVPSTSTTTTIVPSTTTTTTTVPSTTTATTTSPVAPTTTVPPASPVVLGPTPTSTPVSPVPPRSAIATDCSTNVSTVLNAYLNALPNGAVFASPATACYLVDKGIKITHPLVIIGGKFVDQSTTVPPAVPGRGAPSLHPIILINYTSDVTIEDVNLVGADTTGAYRPALVGQSGIDVRSSSNVTIVNATTLDTFGDGLTLFLAPGHGPDRDITVKGLTITKAGRQGITPAFVSGADFTNVNIVSAADNAWDFESDIRGVGSGGITITDSTWKGPVNMIEPLNGPLTFIGDSSSGRLTFDDRAKNQPVLVEYSTLLLPADDPVELPAGVILRGGEMTFSHDVLGRQPSKRPPTGRAWLVTDGGQIVFNHSKVTAPLGSSTGTTVETSNG